MPQEFKVSDEYTGVRIKNYLKKHLDLPYSTLCKHIKNKRITLNGKKIKQEQILEKGDIIKLWLDSIKLREKTTQFKDKKDLGLEILYDNEDFFALNKLPGVVVQGAQETSESLSLHLAYLKQKFNDNSPFEYFHVHRLDKDTSGVLVIAKNRVALRELNEIFRKREVEKKYLCLCDGIFEKKEDKIEIYLQRNTDQSHEKVKIAKKPNPESRRTISHYKVIEEIETPEETFSLVEINIETGFMHQIRVHMNYLNHPILGDTMYGNSYLNEKYSPPRQLLHASSINFKYKNKKHTINAPLPQDFYEFINYLKQ